MLMTKRTNRGLGLGILAGLGLLGTSATASAAAPQSTVILNTATTVAYRAPNAPAGSTPKRRDGAGVMDTTVAFDRTTGDIYSFWTNSVPWGNEPGAEKDANGQGLDTGMQAAMAFTKITTTGLGPVTVKMLPNQANAQRVFMRPTALLGPGYVAVVFASEDDGPNADGNPQAVMWVYDRQGNQLPITNAASNNQGPLDAINLIDLSGQQDGQQQCAHDAIPLPDESDGSQSWVMGVQRNNQNARLMKVNIATDTAGGGVKVSVPYLTTIVQNAQHDRVKIAVPLDGVAHNGQIVATSVEADGQPANYGVDAVLFNTVTGKTISKTRVYSSDPQTGLYAVQPSAQYVSDGIVAFEFQVSNAVRNGPNATNTIGNCNPNNGHCGAPNESNLITMSVPTTAGSPFVKIDSAIRVAPYERHSEAFGMQYGAAGSETAAIGLVGGSSTGMGTGLVQVLPIDATGHIGAIDPMKVYQVSQYSDVAGLAAQTKRDPGQARGFIHGLYGVPNPGYLPNASAPANASAAAKLFMPEVKTFNISAVAGYVDPTTDNRESLTFALVPATWDPSVQTTPGSAVSNVPPGPGTTAPAGTPITNPTGVSAGTTSGNQGGTTGSGTGGIKTGYGALGDASSGCGCTTAGSDSTSGLTGIALMGLGFVFLGMRRNKKES
jgi:MYXO-CTERM domain-containing protein